MGIQELNTKTHSSKEMTELCFENADVKKHLLLQTEDEKRTVTFFRMCQNEALLAVHIFHLTPTQLVWNGVVKDIN